MFHELYVLDIAVHSTKKYFIYYEKNKFYLSANNSSGVHQIGYIQCKFQTLSFQMTPILS